MINIIFYSYQNAQRFAEHARGGEQDDQGEEEGANGVGQGEAGELGH